MNKVNIRAVLLGIFELFGVVFELIIDEVFIYLLLVPIGQKLNSLLLYEVADILVCPVPLLFVKRLEHYTAFVVGDENTLAKLLLFHCLK